MSYYIGLDVGTSSLKAMAISENGVEASASRDYPLYLPQENWSEQNPEDWLKASLEALKELAEKLDASQIKAISFSGQMHGLVMLDENDEVIRPAILWNDGRSTAQVDYLNNVIGKETLLERTGNIAFAGFTLPKLMWVRENEPENFKRAAKIMLPKDYVAYKLSGAFATDVSDAAGTLYFDTKNRTWSNEMLDLIGVGEEKLPKVFESSEAIGTLKPEYAALTGLPESVKIVIGAGDNAASAIGTGTLEDGQSNVSLGTSGTLFVCCDRFGCDRQNAIHSFCSANGKYHYLACTLTAASSLKRMTEDILREGYDFEDEAAKYIGKSSVLFLPYLMGERSPVNDPLAKAKLTGLSLTTTREEILLAVLEGVAFSLRQNLDAIRALGVNITTSKICGGGARTKIWLKIIATILKVDLEIPQLEHGGVLGAAILAAKGSGDSFDAGIFYGVKEVVKPDESLTDFYDKKYTEYLKLYP